MRKSDSDLKYSIAHADPNYLEIKERNDMLKRSLSFFESDHMTDESIALYNKIYSQEKSEKFNSIDNENASI